MEDIKKCVKETAFLLKDAMYLENHYQSVLTHLLTKKGYIVSQEVHVAYKLLSGFTFGSGRIDILFETDREIFILELKTNAKISLTVGQLKRYMIHIPNPSKKIIRGCVVSFNHYNQQTTKFLTLKTHTISSDDT